MPHSVRFSNASLWWYEWSVTPACRWGCPYDVSLRTERWPPVSLARLALRHRNRSFAWQGRCGARLRYGHRPRRPARAKSPAGEFRNPRRGSAPADHLVRQQSSAHPSHRHDRRVREHGGEPSTAACCFRTAHWAPSTRRPDASGHIRPVGRDWSLVHERPARAARYAAACD